jgi:cytochrome P450
MSNIDFISEFAFGESFNLLTSAEDNTFHAPLLDTFDQTIAASWDLIQFPTLRVIAVNAPLALASKLSTAAAKTRVLLDAVQATIDKFRSLQRMGKGFDHVVIFDQMEGLKDGDLLAEATEVLIAGSDTTATTISVAIEEMIKKPAVWEKLKEEVKRVGLVTEQDYEVRKLEQLPFLVRNLHAEESVADMRSLRA